MLSSLGCLLLCGSIALALGNAQKLPKGKIPSLKVHINTTSDSILLKFLRPNPNVKLEGFLLGYGSNISPNQYFPLPADGKSTQAVVDAEPKYLIVVRPAPPPSKKKSCSGKARPRKPLQLVVGTLSPSSVFLSWGFLINPHHDWTLPSHCPNDRFYTIRYREKDKEKKWIFQLCPATETIVENLKPNTVYEFGVKDNVEGGIWSKIFNHKTVVGSKNKVNGKIQSTYDQVHTVPAYIPKKIIPITIIKQVIQNVTHRASTKSPDKTHLGGTILVHLIIPGLNETTIKLPTSIMFEISDAIKTQLAKNETLELPAESKTPEVEKIPAQPVTVTPETVARTATPTVSGALDISEAALVLSEKTPEILQTTQFELPLSTLAPYRLPEFPQAKTPFTFEKPEGTLASSKMPWIVSTTKTSEDSKVLQPTSATYDMPSVFSSPTTSDEPEIAEPHTATSDSILDSVPPKTSRTLERPRATPAPSETPFVPPKLEIFTSPEMQPTPPVPQQTTSIPSTPKRRFKPKSPKPKPARTRSPGTTASKISKSSEPTWTTLAPSKTQFISLKPKISLSPEVTHTKPVAKESLFVPLQPTTSPSPEMSEITPALEPQTLPSSQSTIAPKKTKRPGRRPRPKTTPSPEGPKSSPALEPATVKPELLVPTIASKPSKRPKTTRRPDAPQIQPDSKPPKQLLPKPQTTAKPAMPPTKSVFEPVTFETEIPSITVVPATDFEPVTLRTEAPGTTLAPKTSQRTRTRRPRPKPKTTPSPKAPQTELDFEPVTPGTSLATTTTKRTRRPKPKTMPHPEVPQSTLVPATILEPDILRTKAPGTTLAPKIPQRTRRPRPKPKTTPSPDTPQAKLVPSTILEPVTPITEAPRTALVPVTDLEPVTFRTETSGTPLATKTSQRTRRPRPRPKTTPSPQAPQTKPASQTSTRTDRPRPRPKTTPSPEAPVYKPVPTADLEPVILRTEAPVTTQAPKTSKRTRRPRPKTKTTPRPAAPQTKPVPATDLEPVALRTEAPEIMVLTTVIEPVTLRTEAPETTLAPETTKQTRRPRPRPKTTPRPQVPQTKSVPATVFEPVIYSTEAPGTTLAPTELQTLILKPVTPPSLEIQQSQPASAETHYVHPTAKAPPLRPEQPMTEAVVESVTNVSEPRETTLDISPLPSKTIILPSPDEPPTKPAPKQTPRAPPKPKTSPRPRIPQTQSVPKHVTSKPKTSPSPEVSRTTSVLEESTIRIEQAKTTIVPKEVLLPHKPSPEISQSEPVLQPVTFRIDLPKTTIAPLETRGLPFIPMISPSPSQEELQTTLAETDKSTQEFFTSKIPRTAESAKTTQAPHRLYTTPVRPRPPDKPQVRPGVKQPIPVDITEPSGASRNVSVVSTRSTKRPATIPGTHRPLLPPTPKPPRRKPLPPNNVTGKPGSAGVVSSARVTSPPMRATIRPTGVPLERAETDKKQPTAPASGEELGNVTDFSSSPTRETDPLGKPRFKGPHVRYIQKPDDKPCSITDSVKRFPTEEGLEGNATSPPQNPPTNLTVVTVEGCPSFVILDWEKPLNDTVTEYEVISRENGSFSEKNKSIQITNQTFSTVENLKPDTSYEFQVKPKNPLGEGPVSDTVAFSTESADPRVSEPVYAGRDAIWTERPFNSDSYSECKGKQYVKRTWYKKFVGVQLCNSLRYKIYLSDSLTGKFYNIGDQRGHGEDHCQFVDSFLDGRTGQQLTSDQLPTKEGYFRAVRQEPVQFGEIGGQTQINYVQWYECGTTIPGKW
ncbi:target of Nesh-SH3 isoform X6 [Choloepus didactylus]|uniref:target of Nesh-SH3 isoform X6 n=1 Tax=Choloepus didactylus TaxID=27675 RepID=UPI00189C8CC1|nr:target of Nesh-SH3 isoform X6 [Choloepus didactylus]